MDIEEDQNYQKMRKNKKLRKKQKTQSYDDDESDQYQLSDDSSQQGHHDTYQLDDFVVKDDQSDSDYDDQQKQKDKVILVREKDDYMSEIQRRNKNRLHKKKDQYRNSYQNRNEYEDSDQEFQQEDNDDREFDNYDLIFEPQDLIENYETTFDKNIIETDIPERLQLRYKNDIPKEQELFMEATWLTNIIIQKKKIQETQTKNLIENVFKILQFIKLEKFEVMYIWLYKKQNFIQKDNCAYQLELEDLQLIYDRDLEWAEIYKKKQKVDHILSLIQHELNIPMNQLQIYKNYIELNELLYLEEYLMYELKKTKRQFEIDELLNIKNSYKKRQIRQFCYEMHKLNIQQIIYSAFQQPKHFADNLLKSQLYHVTQNPQESLQQFAQLLTQPQQILLEDSEKAMNNCFNYIAGEYFNHPIIKSYLQQLYNDNVTINTNPTDNGKKLNMYNYYYVTKRIRNKKPNNLNLELWFLMRESQQKNLIKIEFILSQDQQEDIMAKLLQYNNLNNIENDQWYLAKKEVMRILINNYMIPYFEKKLTEELNKWAEQFIQQKCSEEFKKLINIKPYRTQYFKILACTVDEQENTVFGMINETGDLMDHMTLYNIIKKPMDYQLSKLTLYEEDKQAVVRFIETYQPNVITISPKNIKAQQLKLNLGSIIEDIYQEASNKPFLLWSDMKVSSTFAKCKISQKLMPDLNTNLKELISSARFIQNPLSETLNLWSDNIKENYLFHINYHPLQHFINKENMKNEFEKLICEVVNDQGVDINNCIQYKHMQSPLQFVCGFGPRKANYLIKKLNKKQNIIYRREDLKIYLKDKVYENAIAFIKVNENLNPQKGNSMMDAHYWLDFTRIHPQFYHIAIKIAKEALDEEDDDENRIIFKLLQDSSYIDKLDLEDYGKHMSQKQNCNMHCVIKFILDEFNNPFKDNRKDFETKPDEKKIFYSLIQESEHLLKEEMILTVKIVMIDDRGFKVQTSSGIFGVVPGNEISNDYNENEILDQYQVGQFIKAKVLKIVYDKLYLKLTIKEEEFRDPKSYLKRNDIFKFYDLIDDNTFLIVREEDYPSQETVQRRTVRTFVPRRIAHPHFKNIGLRKVLEQFLDKQNGVFIFRPSTSRGHDYINLTWKFYNNVIVHLPIKEGYKSSNESLSSELYLENTTYQSLDEIIQNFIKPCNLHVQLIEKDPKFEGKEINQVKEGLVDKKQSNRKKTPYCFSFTSEKPSFLILSYVMDNLKVQHELIKVKPSGLKFHEVTFKNLELLKKFFKEKFKTKQYQSFLDQQPKIELGRQKTFIGVKEEVKQEKREYKREDRYDDRYQSNRYDDRYQRNRRDDDYRREDRYQQRSYRDDRRSRRDRDYRDRIDRDYNNRDDRDDRNDRDYRDGDRDFDRRRKIEKNYDNRQRNRRDEYQDRRNKRKRSFDDDQPQQMMQGYQDSQQINYNSYREMGGYSPFNNPYQQQPTPQRNPNDTGLKFEHA